MDSHGTLKQEDFSKWIEITPENYRYRLQQHNQFDVPRYTEAALRDIERYLYNDHEVYQYILCWVPEYWMVDGVQWLYTGKVAELKNIQYRKAREACAVGKLTSEFFKVNDGYPKRRYVKPDEKFIEWMQLS